MRVDLSDLGAFLAVAQARGFREAARSTEASPSYLSKAMRRLEDRLGVRLLNRTTRSVTLTEAGERLLERLSPALSEVDAALDVVNSFRDRPKGTLKLTVPFGVAHTVLPGILPRFIAEYPEILLEITAEDSLVDLLADGYDAGIRYDDRLEQDMIAIPIGPRVQRFATAASPDYLRRHGRPEHPRDLLNQQCLRCRFASGILAPWEFERDGEILRVDPQGPLTVRSGGAVKLVIDAALSGSGIVHLYEDWLKPYLDDGSLEPVLEPWWQTFSGPFLYHPGRKLVPAPLRAFIDFVKVWRKEPPP